MATYSSILGGRIPWTEEPGRLPSMGSQRVRHKLVIKQQQQRGHISRKYLNTGSWEDFPGCPVAKTPCPYAGGPGSPGSGN